MERQCQGYIEDTRAPRNFRDIFVRSPASGPRYAVRPMRLTPTPSHARFYTGQVNSIWEGTTNVLSLDVLRVLGQGDSFGAFATVRGSPASSGRSGGAAHSAPPFRCVVSADHDVQRLEQLLDGADPEVAGPLRESFKALQKYLGAAARAEYVRPIARCGWGAPWTH